MILLNLFLAFLRVGLFAIGGAYSFLPLIEREVVEKYHWLSNEEFLDVLGGVQIFPGAISIKYASYTGYKIGGIFGAILAILGTLVAPVISVIVASIWYNKYKNAPHIKGAFNMIQLTVLAMLIAVAFKLMSPGQLIQPKNLFIVVAAFTLFIYTKIHPALIIISAGILGACLR